MERRPQELVPLVVALLWGAALVHTLLVPAHLDESWLHGGFFLAAAAWQAAWGARMLRDTSPRVLTVGAIGSCCIAFVWLLSRTIGLPLTFGDWQREPVGGLDVLTTLDELAAAMLIAQVIGFRAAGRSALTTNRLLAASILVGVLLTATLLAPMVGGHGHS